MVQENMEPSGKSPPNKIEGEKTVGAPEVAAEVAPEVAIKGVEEKEDISERLREATECLKIVAKLLGDSYVFLDPDTIAWEIQTVDGQQVPVLSFDDIDMYRLVNEQSPETQEECNKNLKKIFTLFTEEEKKLQEAQRPNKIDCGPRLTDIESAFASFASYFDLKHLHTIKTLDEALQSSEREAAKQFLLAIFSQIQKLQVETNITQEQLHTVNREYREHYHAVGTISFGIVDHTR